MCGVQGARGKQFMRPPQIYAEQAIHARSPVTCGVPNSWISSIVWSGGNSCGSSSPYVMHNSCLLVQFNWLVGVRLTP